MKLKYYIYAALIAIAIACTAAIVAVKSFFKGMMEAIFGR
jgi:hypothetical protein